MSDTFEGRVRVLDLNGLLIDVGKASLRRIDPETGSTWGGTLRIFTGAALASKAIEAELDLGNGAHGRALVGPQVGGLVEGELIDVEVAGLDDAVPF